MKKQTFYLKLLVFVLVISSYCFTSCNHNSEQEPEETEVEQKDNELTFAWVLTGTESENSWTYTTYKEEIKSQRNRTYEYYKSNKDYKFVEITIEENKRYNNLNEVIFEKFTKKEVLETRTPVKLLTINTVYNKVNNEWVEDSWSNNMNYYDKNGMNYKHEYTTSSGESGSYEYEVIFIEKKQDGTEVYKTYTKGQDPSNYSLYEVKNGVFNSCLYVNNKLVNKVEWVPSENETLMQLWPDFLTFKNTNYDENGNIASVFRNDVNLESYDENTIVFSKFSEEIYDDPDEPYTFKNEGYETNKRIDLPYTGN